MKYLIQSFLKQGTLIQHQVTLTFFKQCSAAQTHLLYTPG